MPRNDMLIALPADKVAKKTSHYDGWQNFATGIGTRKDKRRYNNFKLDVIYPIETHVEAYSSDGLVRRIVDCIPEDAFREWGYFKGDPEDEDGDGVLERELLRLQAPTIFAKAGSWARLTGGALIYIGAIGAGAPNTPLVAEKIKNIEFLKVIDLGDIVTSSCKFNTDLSSPDFGKIETYHVRIRAGNDATYRDIHASRCIPLYGTPLPSSSFMGGMTLELRHWGVSIMQYIYDDLRDFRGAFANTAAILQEFIIGKYKFSDLDEMLAAGNETRLQNRIQGMEMTKSLINAVMLGVDEEYTRDSASVTGIPELLDRFMMMMSAVTGIPVTKLFGRSPGGLNATGDSDSGNYYDQVRSYQIGLTTYIQNFGQIIMGWKKIKGDHPWVWNPLYQQTEEQKANAERIKAENSRTLADADQRMLQEGVLQPGDVWKMRFEETLGPRADSEFEIPIEPSPGPMGAMPEEEGIPPKKEEVVVAPKKALPKK